MAAHGWTEVPTSKGEISAGWGSIALPTKNKSKIVVDVSAIKPHSPYMNKNTKQITLPAPKLGSEVRVKAEGTFHMARGVVTWVSNSGSLFGITLPGVHGEVDFSADELTVLTH